MGVGYNPRIVTDGLVLCLDAANRKSYPGSGNTWIDLSGNGNSGTLTNGPIFANNSIAFDGVNDYIDCGNGSTINIVDSLTLSVWFRLPTGYGNSGWNSILAKRNASVSTNYGINYNPSTTNFQWYFNTAGTFKVHTISLTTNFSANTWTNFTGIFSKNGTSTDSYIYKNGNLISTTNLSTNVTTSSTNLLIGNFDLIFTEPWLGTIGVLNIYNRALSATEVQQNFNALRGRYGI